MHKSKRLNKQFAWNDIYVFIGQNIPLWCLGCSKHVDA